MTDRNTGFHTSDADWTRGRALAVADAEALARRQIGLARKVTISKQTEGGQNG